LPHQWFLGDEIPVEGARFPERIAPVIEFQGAAVLDALARIEGSDGTPQHLSRDAEPPCTCQQLKMDPGPAERARPGKPPNSDRQRDGVLIEDRRVPITGWPKRVGSTIG
jgi:hypothetical protein